MNGCERYGSASSSLAERVAAFRVFIETGLILNHYVAWDVLNGAIREGQVFPDALVEFLAGSTVDAYGQAITLHDRQAMLTFYYRCGWIHDRQWQAVIADHPELADALAQMNAVLASISSRPLPPRGAQKWAAWLRALLSRRPHLRDVAAECLGVQPRAMEGIALGRVQISRRRWQKLWIALGEGQP